MDYDKLTSAEYVGLLNVIERAEADLHVFRASLADGGEAAVNAHEHCNREHQRMENYISLLNARQLFGKEAAV